MKTTKDAIIKLNTGKTIHGVVIEQTIQPDSVVFIDYKNIEKLGRECIKNLLEFIPLVSVKEVDFCVK